MKGFLRGQIKELKAGGINVLFRKMRTLLLKIAEIPLMVIAVPVVLLVRLLRPFVVIRFGPLISSRIGHFAIDTEVYLCERDAGLHGKGEIDIFYHLRPISNVQLQKMWERVLPVSRFACWVDKINRMMPGGEKHIIPRRRNACRDIHGLLRDTKPHVFFTDEEERFGREQLQEIGIKEGIPFVCFHARDSAYLNTALEGGDWQYHNYRDSDINNYIPAVEGLVRSGYVAVRMGAVQGKRLNTSNPGIIDYASNYRTEFLDVYLGAKCKFFICDTAGIYAISEVFRRPVAWVNYTSIEYAPTYGLDHLYIPKKLWLKKEKRFLTFREILTSDIGRFTNTEEYEREGIELIENRPDEITALVMEMDERMNGKWQTTPEDEKLQQRFRSFFKPSELNKVFLARIGAEFLRQNTELLELDGKEFAEYSKGESR